MDISSLNDRQKEAVLYNDGPLLIIAGAGAGKTKTLTTKIAYLIEEENVNPHNILAITFTKKATAEMRERLDDYMGAISSKQVHISTIHSLCNYILRRHIYHLGYERGFEIIDDDEMLKVLTEVYKEENIDRKLYSPRTMVKIIGDYKNGLRPLEDVEKDIYDSYQKYLKANNMHHEQ